MSQTIGRTKLAFSRTWHHIDISRTQLAYGRLATQIAIILMGKHKPIYDPSTDCGDYVVVTNVKDFLVSGRKLQQKLYYSHTTRPGSLKSISMENLIAKYGQSEILKRAVRGMLPKNKLRDVRLARLKCFDGPHHPYQANIFKFYDPFAPSANSMDPFTRHSSCMPESIRCHG